MTAESSTQQRLLIVEDDVHIAYLLGYLAEQGTSRLKPLPMSAGVQRINSGSPSIWCCWTSSPCQWLPSC